MSKTATDNTVLNEARTALRFWTDNPDIKVAETSCAGLKRSADQLEAKSNEAKLQEEALRQLNLDRDRLIRHLRQVNSQVKMAARVRYGSSSSEYAALGGTRPVDRKPRARANGATGPMNGNGKANGKANGDAAVNQDANGNGNQ